MATATAKKTGDGEESAATGSNVKFRFSKMWSGDPGLFSPGDMAELPQEIADSLYLEEMGERA